MTVKCTDNSKSIMPCFTVGKEYRIYESGQVVADDGFVFKSQPSAQKMLEFISSVYGFEIVDNG